ncbi:MAG TPA: glycosyltransferase [Caulobacteraceae bacterium]|jgi:UDP-N-acetylglucosamine transferase subunit ALG13
MILLTVGTTMPFDELLAEADRLAGEGRFGDEALVCQSGHSNYQVRNGRQFVGLPSLRDLIDESSLVITHGGSTVIQLLLARKPFVAFPNPRGAADHQTSFLREMANSCDISWSPYVADLERLIVERRGKGPAELSTAIPRAADEIRAMLGLSA